MRVSGTIGSSNREELLGSEVCELPQAPDQAAGNQSPEEERGGSLGPCEDLKVIREQAGMPAQWAGSLM